MRKAFILLISVFPVILYAQGVTSNPQVIDNGGGKSYAGGVENQGSVGQNVVGLSTVEGNVRNYAGFINVYEVEVTEVQDPDVVSLPERIDVDGPYPNPFNSTCHFDISVPEPTDLKFEVFDVLGHKVYSQSKFYKYGLYHLTFKSGNLPTGVYLYRISAEHININGKFLLVK